MLLLKKSPEYEGLATMAIDDIRLEIMNKFIHAVPQGNKLRRRGRIERKCDGGQSQFSCFLDGRCPFQSSHKGFMPGFLQTMRQGHPIPGSGVIPADIDDLNRAHNPSLNQ